jgi:hypothetical protein
MEDLQRKYLRAIGSNRWRRAFIVSAIAGFLVGAGAMYLRGQTGTPFVSTAAIVPPSIGSPGVSLAWDTTNKFLVVTFSIANATGAVSTLSTWSYNPHTLEGSGGGETVVEAAGTIVLLIHNKPADPLTYQIGVSVPGPTGATITTIAAQCTTVTPVPTGQTACPALPF